MSTNPTTQSSNLPPASAAAAAAEQHDDDDDQPSSSPSKPPAATTATTPHVTSRASKLLMFIRSELLPDDPINTIITTTTTPSSSSDTPDPDHHQHQDPSYTHHYYAARRREKLITFVSIPKELEKLMGYGFFQCADAFLYVFTFLPLRCCYAVYKWVLCKAAWLLSGGDGGTTSTLRASDKCELIKIVILLLSSVAFMYIDTNVLYHVIKSQSVIKLYIFFNMLEVGDRLFGCFSQDTLDALFITATEQTTDDPVTNTTTTTSSPSSPSHSVPNATEDTTSTTKQQQQQYHHHHHPHHLKQPRKKFSTTAHAMICGVSILGHALVILLQSTTLSVAINANNRALLTVMMSNNFVELKGSVFKKFDKMNLFQVTCSDIRERFHLFVLLLIVCLQTLREYSWEESRFWVLLPDCLMVLLAEIMVDWIKHAFITRFNELPPQVYNHYTRSLAYDMAESVKKKSRSFSCDYSDVVGRRLGFVPLPLAIVLIRVVTPMFRVTNVGGLVVLCLVGYVGLASFRILNTIVLVGKAVRIIDEHCYENSAAAAGAAGTFWGTASNTAPYYAEGGSSPNKSGGGGSSSSSSNTQKNSILKRSRTISGSDGDILLAIKNEQQHYEKKKLTFVGLKDDGETIGLQKIHLLANSNVSLTSVGFNEEMLKVEEEGGKNKIAGGVLVVEGGLRLGSRKHSLGSNLDDENKILLGSGCCGDGLVVSDGAVIKKEPGVLLLGGGRDAEQENLNNTMLEVVDLSNVVKVEGEVDAAAAAASMGIIDDHDMVFKEEVVGVEQQEHDVEQQELLSSSVDDPLLGGNSSSSSGGVAGNSASSSVNKKKKFAWFK